mgnify:FL=1|jgi:hypothetical protein
MRTTITTSTLLVSLVIIVLIHCTLIGHNARENEISSGLNSSIDYAYGKMMDYYEDKEFIDKYVETDPFGFAKYDENNKLIFKIDVETVKKELVNKFCEILQQRLGSDGKIKVQVLYMDLDEGTFQVNVTEYYAYPLSSKTGACMYEKTYTLY